MEAIAPRAATRDGARLRLENVCNPELVKEVLD
jgi:hypothetical protein